MESNSRATTSLDQGWDNEREQRNGVETPEVELIYDYSSSASDEETGVKIRGRTPRVLQQRSASRTGTIIGSIF